MHKNYDELVEEAGRFLAEGERLHFEAIQHLDNPEIQAAVDRYIVEADLLARAFEETRPEE